MLSAYVYTGRRCPLCVISGRQLSRIRRVLLGAPTWPVCDEHTELYESSLARRDHTTAGLIEEAEQQEREWKGRYGDKIPN